MGYGGGEDVLGERKEVRTVWWLCEGERFLGRVRPLHGAILAILFLLFLNRTEMMGFTMQPRTRKTRVLFFVPNGLW